MNRSPDSVLNGAKLGWVNLMSPHGPTSEYALKNMPSMASLMATHSDQLSKDLRVFGETPSHGGNRFKCIYLMYLFIYISLYIYIYTFSFCIWVGACFMFITIRENDPI